MVADEAAVVGVRANGVGLQGEGVQARTGRQLRHLVRVLDRVGVHVDDFEAVMHGQRGKVRDVVESGVELAEAVERGDAVQVCQAASGDPEDLQIT